MINLHIKRNILLNPGPATTTDSVKLAQVVPDICPREEEFGHLMQDISNELTRFVADPEAYTAVLFGGSGTSAVESMISSVIGENAILIINNGAYGKRICEIAEAYQIPFVEFKSAPDDALDLTRLETLIQNSSCTISHLAVVHHETTTGLLNDVAAIGEMCRRHQIELIVDAMSSFAAVPIDLSEMNISYLAASSNKNIQGMAGVAFVIAPTEKLESLQWIKPRNYYLNLHAQYEYFSKNRQMRFTPPVQTIYALKQAILELKAEGVKERYARYARSWTTLTEGLARLGLTHIVKKEDHGKMITAVTEPDCSGFDFYAMHDYLHSRGFTIYPGKLAQFRNFRIANIGDITYKEIEAFLEVFERYLLMIGHTRSGVNSQ